MLLCGGGGVGAERVGGNVGCGRTEGAVTTGVVTQKGNIGGERMGGDERSGRQRRCRAWKG